MLMKLASQEDELQKLRVEFIASKNEAHLYEGLAQVREDLAVIMDELEGT